MRIGGLRALGALGKEVGLLAGEQHRTWPRFGRDGTHTVRFLQRIAPMPYGLTQQGVRCFADSRRFGITNQLGKLMLESKDIDVSGLPYVAFEIGDLSVATV